MNLYRSLHDVSFERETVLTVGTFDGVHRAHQDILQTLQQRAQLYKRRNFVITFDPHPRTVIEKNSSLKALTTLDERIALFHQFNVENLLILRFTKEFSELSFREFYKEYIITTIGVAEVVEGYNHHFGKGREGNGSTLLELGNEFNFSVVLRDPLVQNGDPISSSRIRKALEEGDLENANAMLGYPYFIEGTVVEGDKRGRKLGYPTANLLVSQEKLIPKSGIYFSSVDFAGGQYYGITSIGKRPTFYKNGELLVEVYILDFQQDIYGQPIRIALLKRLRDEQKFDRAEELIEQMNRDREISKVLIKTFRVA